MIGLTAFLAGRAAVVAFALMCWAYALTTYSAFAHDMFVAPRLLPWLQDFVAWHHLWAFGAYVISVLTLLPDLRRLAAPAGRRRLAPWLALAYVVALGAVASTLLSTPYLPALPSRAEDLGASMVPLVPLVWLALVDWAAAWPTDDGPSAAPTLTPAPLLAAALASTVVVWTLHFGRLVVGGTAASSATGWIFAAAWTLTLTLTGFVALFAVLAVAVTLGSRARRGGSGAVILATLAMGVAIAGFFQHLVFGSLAFDRADPLWLAAAVGLTLALAWSGVMLRAATMRRPGAAVDVDSLFGAWSGSARGALVGLVAVQTAAWWASTRIEHIDWDFVVQRAIAAVECVAVFGLMVALARWHATRRWPARHVVAVPLVAVAAMHLLPRLAERLPGDDSRRRPPVDALFDHVAAVDPVFGLLTRILVEQPPPDADFFRDVLRSSARSLETPTAVPEVAFAAPLPPAPWRPHVFVFVIDSLRRDYLSAINPAARFTPGIEAWARQSYVFDNAFTRYGGTWLAIPSMWVGGELPRAWGRMALPRANGLEKLIRANDYHLVLNDYTVAPSLMPDPGRTFLDPELRSIGSDLCSQVDGLERILAARDPRPVFAFLAPMNVHTLTATPAPPLPASTAAGFDATYAARLQRIDACFGRFTRYLQDSGLADDSVVILTSDHGDSLGEGGQWGHSYTLVPEVVRIPLVVQLPSRLRRTLTTDLSQVAFSTDLTPTLYRLLGYEVRDLGPHFGMPLFVEVAASLPDRRRRSFLLMSSYGATYGLLRRNGRLLYIADLVGAREYAYDLRDGFLGSRVVLDAATRRLSQAAIREQIRGVEALYHPTVAAPAAAP